MDEQHNTELDRIAFQLNAHLPAGYQSEIRTEGERFHDGVLAPRSLAARKVLIVGGAGYIGVELTSHLLESGYAVRSTDNFTYGFESTVYPFLRHPHFEFRRGDLCDPDHIADALQGVTDVVILAGLVGDPITKKYPQESDRVNLQGIQRLLDQLNGRKLNKVIFVSTCSNYGLIPEDAVADEDYELKPLSLYAEAKVAAEKAVLDSRGAVDYHPTVLRFATAFGISGRMRFDLSLSEFTRELYVGNELLVYDPDTWRPYCHVQDFSEVIRRVLEAPVKKVSFGVFNAGGDANNRTKRMMVEEIADFVPNARIRYKEQGVDPRNYRVDFSRIRDTLHFEPRWTVTDGITELVAALKQNLFHDLAAYRNFYGNYQIPALD